MSGNEEEEEVRTSVERGSGDSRRWFILILVFALGWLLYLLGPVLTPFVIAAFLAYVGDPMADRLEALGLSRTASVITVFAALTLAGFLLLLFLVPVIGQQFETLISNVPVAIDWFQRNLLPMLAGSPLFQESGFDVEAVKKAIVSHWEEIAGAATGLVRKLTVSGQAVLAWILDVVLVPVVTFYLLRDWDVLVAHVRQLLPRRYEARIVQLARECDEVLAGFLRGQLLVMLALSVIYILGLWAVGLNLAFSIGLLAGFVSFVPYLGFIVGITVAGIAALIQYQDLVYVLYVAIVFGIAEIIQGLVLSPWLVGGQIGMHPVTVIFAILAGGQLFGFVGVLLGLPAAAVVVVLLRHGRKLYLSSDFYVP